jgi:predicted esterase
LVLGGATVLTGKPIKFKENCNFRLNLTSSLWQAEIDKGIEPSRIVLVGFGQGGATVLTAACHSLTHTIGGVVCIAGDAKQHVHKETLSNLPLVLGVSFYLPVCTCGVE